MPRPRNLDPSNLPASPNLAMDHARIEELLAEYKKRLRFLSQSYFFCIRADTMHGGFNESLRRLRNRVAGRTRATERGERVHPYIELAINIEARRIADREDALIDQQIIERAAANVATSSHLLRGRPATPILRHHVTGLLALTQQFSGRPVLARKTRRFDEYDPHIPGSLGLAMVRIVQSWDETVTETQLGNLLRLIRKQYAGKPLRFIDLFPNYGSCIDPRGCPEFAAPYKVESFTPNIPIYCP